MPELRTDWLSGRTVIVAENRAQRPNEFSAEATALVAAGADADAGMPSVANLTLAEAGLPAVAGVPSCPFCVGSESRTPAAVYEQLDERRQWRLRIVPNKFPALTLDAQRTAETAAGHRSDPAARAAAAMGAHEVIVESARHIDRTSLLSARELRHVLEAYAARLQHWRADGRFQYGLVFKNQGPRAGASIAHLHSQLIALPVVPPAVQAEIDRASEDYSRHQSCPYCRLIAQERSLGQRVVFDRDGYIAFCPFASMQPHEVWLLPTSHEPSFERIVSVERLGRLSGLLHALVARLESIVPGASYNFVLATAPWIGGCDDWFHWRIELLPRANAFAGLELATGLFTNPMPPERAARHLRTT